MVLRVITTPVIARLVPPVLEPKQTGLDVSNQARGDVWALIITVDNPQQTCDREVNTVLPGVDKGQRFANWPSSTGCPNSSRAIWLKKPIRPQRLRCTIRQILLPPLFEGEARLTPELVLHECLCVSW